jgi:hypothetical protein
MKCIVTKEDKKYVIERNKLIPLAEKFATMKVNELGIASRQEEGKDGCPFNWSYWNEFFHKEMNRLAIEKKLIKGVNK